MIYFDNAATTYPKPRAVREAVAHALTQLGANPGRGGHKMAYAAAEEIYGVRTALSQFFDLGAPENVIFTKNCTEALNLVIKGLAHPGCHFVCSDLEHNAVARPLETLKQRGVCTWEAAQTGKTDEETVAGFQACIRKNTAAIICTGASNVFGKALPLEKLSALAHAHGIPLVADLAQTAGILPISLRKSGVDFACAPGHKGLYGPMGTGVLLCNSAVQLETLMEGGTGNFSAQLTQPVNYPERLESGTLNVPGITGLGAGVRAVQKRGVSEIYTREMQFARHIAAALSHMPNVQLYTDLESQTERFAPLLSFTIRGMHSEEVGAALARRGVAVRAGLHCAVLAHRTYGTAETGTVRICPSIFTKTQDVKSLLNSIFQIAKDA